MATTGDLVPVGQVFEVFQGKHDNYYGADISSAIAPGCELVFRDPSGQHPEVTGRVSTIEIERRRTNVALPGNKCGIKLAHRPRREITKGEQVFTRELFTMKASSIKQELTPRPPRFTDMERAARRSKVW